MTTHHNPGAFETIVSPTGSFALLPDRESAQTALTAMLHRAGFAGRVI
ncbi:hypothetical protein [Streptomyces sp. NPDC001020]